MLPIYATLAERDGTDRNQGSLYGLAADPRSVHLLWSSHGFRSVHAPLLRPPVSAPTRLRVPDLLHAVDQAADDVLQRPLRPSAARRRPAHRRPLVHPHPRRRRAGRLADQLGARTTPPNCTTTAARSAR